MSTHLSTSGLLFSMVLLLGTAPLGAQPMGSSPGWGSPPAMAPVYADGAMPEATVMPGGPGSMPMMPYDPGMPPGMAGGPGYPGSSPFMGVAQPMAPGMGSPAAMGGYPEGVAVAEDGTPVQYPAGPIANYAGGTDGAPPDEGPYTDGSPAIAMTDGHWDAPYADHDPLIGLYGFEEVATWRGLTTGDLPSNNGINQGANMGMPLPWLSQFGFGAQLGASYGIYNFDGRKATNDPGGTEQQTFLTGGIYRRADDGRRWSGGAVYDVMWNKNFGAFNASPTLTQVRIQFAYALGYWNEIGVWGAVRGKADTNNIVVTPGLPTTPAYFRPINQINLFWHHKWGLGGADSTLYFGLPDRVRLTDPIFGGGGSLGEFIVGGNLNVPITSCLALYGNAMYMKPSANYNAPNASLQDFWNVAFGLSFYPGRGARSSTVAGRSAMPYMPVANNGSFLVNTNRTF